MGEGPLPRPTPVFFGGGVLGLFLALGSES